MNSLPDHIHITGGSGSGTTALGSRISLKHGHRHIDTDDVFWAPTDPPFQTVRSREERCRIFRDQLGEKPWVLSGAIGEWGYEFEGLFDLVIWLTVPQCVRLARLEARQREQFGTRIDPGGDMEATTVEFFRWAAAYDSGDASMRSFARHEAWTKKLHCRIVRVDGDHTVDSVLAIVETEWQRQTLTN